ncbi:hypothetical protein [Deinococcus kurensis]|uniref:hypothetical protein n=1 Tax=Deinococcus kurensis TaxID=2662757 RepID=UPI0012D2BBED|nr:hypothetical protein [Deinococcus kurensis]
MTNAVNTSTVREHLDAITRQSNIIAGASLVNDRAAIIAATHVIDEHTSAISDLLEGDE